MFYPPSQKQQQSAMPGPGAPAAPKGGYFKLDCDPYARFESLTEAQAAAKKRNGTTRILVMNEWHRKISEVG